MSAYRSYIRAQTTNADFSSVNHVIATAAIPAATKAAQESEFRMAAMTTNKPALPNYIKDTNPKASAYLSSYYLAQASIINKGDDKKEAQANTKTGSGVGNLLADVTGTTTAAKTGVKTTATGKSGKPTSTGTKKPSATKGQDPAIALKSSSTGTTKPSATKGQDPAIALKSSSTKSGSSSTSTGVKPLKTTGKPKASTTKTNAQSTGTGTASSNSSTGAAAMAQPTGAMKMAGVGMLGVAGVAAFL